MEKETYDKDETVIQLTQNFNLQSYDNEKNLIIEYNEIEKMSEIRSFEKQDEKNTNGKIQSFSFFFYLSNLGPNLFAGIAYYFLGFLERHFLGKENTDLMTGVGLAKDYSFFFTFSNMAISDSIGLIAAKHFGAKNYYNIGQTRNLVALIILINFSLYVFVSLLFSRSILKIISTQSYKIVKIAINYIKFTFLNILIEAQYYVLKNYFESHLIFHPTWFSTISGIIFYPFFAFLFIKFLKMGAFGAAIAFTIDSFLKLTILLVYLFFYNKYPQSNVGFNSDTFNCEHVSKAIKIILENFVSILSEVVSFIIGVILVNRLGIQQYSIMLLYNAIMTLNLGFSLGWMLTNIILIGKYVGQKRPDLIRNAISHNFLAAIIFYFPLVVLALIFRNKIMLFFTDDKSILEYDHLKTVLILAVIHLAVDFLYCNYSGILKGLGEVKFASNLSVVFLIIVNPVLSYLLAFKLNLQLVGIFISLISVYSVLLIIFFIYYQFFLDLEKICENYSKQNLIDMNSEDKEN